MIHRLYLLNPKSQLAVESFLFFEGSVFLVLTGYSFPNLFAAIDSIVHSHALSLPNVVTITPIPFLLQLGYFSSSLSDLQYWHVYLE